MPQFYKVLKADPLGDPWTPNFPDAKPIQNYWCQVEGEELNVSIGKQVGNVVTPGESVYGDLVKATSQKSGNQYWKFKSAKVPDNVERPASTPAQATAQAATGGGQPPVDMSARMPDWFMPISNQIDYIYREMKKMDSTLDDPTPATKPSEPAPVKEKATEVKQVAGEPISEQEQAKLDGIFNTEPEPPEAEDK